MLIDRIKKIEIATLAAGLWSNAFFSVIAILAFWNLRWERMNLTLNHNVGRALNHTLISCNVDFKWLFYSMRIEASTWDATVFRKMYVEVVKDVTNKVVIVPSARRVAPFWPTGLKLYYLNFVPLDLSKL